MISPRVAGKHVASIFAADTAFALDPQIKRECIWTGPALRPSAVLCDRLGGLVKIRDDDGGWSRPYPIRSCDSMLSEFAGPHRAPEVLGLRETIRSWRFYDHIRTDADAPARRSTIGTRTFVLDHDGADLAAALQTIAEVGEASALDAAIDSAFLGSRLSIARADTGVLSVQLHQRGLLRPSGPGNSPMARCGTCCGLRRCSARARPACSC